MQENLLRLLDTVNNPLNILLIVLLASCGLYFTVRSRFMQLRMLPEMLRMLFEPSSRKDHKPGEKVISPFKAFAISLGARVGTGNLAGVAAAIATGGAGAVFWMWMMAILGGVNSFMESTLAQMYKQRSGNGFIGGPAYYILKGIGNRWMAALFALLCIVNYGLTNNMIQATTIVSSWHLSFGIPTWLMAALVTAFTLFIVFGGVHRIAGFSAWIVPTMAVSYLLLTAIVLAVNYETIPHAFALIFREAFSPQAAVGGGIGTAIMIGFRRGLFSNEAGLGSSPNAAATASTSHPAKQGLIQALGVYTDTILICTCTALLILCSGLYGSDLSGIELTQRALCTYIGPSGDYILALLIFVFAFSSVVANTYYGEANVHYLFPEKKAAILGYRLLLGLVVMVGGLSTVQLVWGIVDFTQALMAICNIMALCFIGKQALQCLRDYEAQRKQGLDPTYRNEHLECWQQ